MQRKRNKLQIKMDFQEFRVLPRIVSQILIHGVRHLLTYLVATGSYFLYFFLRLSTYLANLPPPLTLPLSQFIIHSLSYLLLLCTYQRLYLLLTNSLFLSALSIRCLFLHLSVCLFRSSLNDCL